MLNSLRRRLASTETRWVTRRTRSRVKIYALIGRIRLVSPRPVVTAAERTLDTISQTYLSPNRTLHEVMDDFRRGGSDFFTEFGEACRQDLGLD
jgi:hypothetical protein